MRPAAALAAAPVALVLAGCGSGPSDVADGSYRAYATSGTQSLDADLTITGEQAIVTTGDAESTFAIGVPGDSFVLCPPDGSGQPRPLDGQLTFGTLTLDEPAVFGDCGTTSPLRVTLVDLASYDAANGPFPFMEWVEFCDLEDPDCS